MTSQDPKLLRMSEVALLELVRFVPYKDRKMLTLACSKFKNICRLVSSSTAHPEKINVHHNRNCCRTIYKLSKNMAQGLEFNGVKGISITVNSLVYQPNCTKTCDDCTHLSPFVSFIDSKLKFKYVYLDLPEYELFQKNCPLPIIIGSWLQKQCTYIKKMSLHDEALTWIIKSATLTEYHDSCQKLLFTRLSHLKVGGFKAKNEELLQLMQMCPNLNSLHVCGVVNLLYKIPIERIQLVTWIAVHEDDVRWNQDNLKTLAEKKPSLKRIYIQLPIEQQIVLPCLASIFRSSQATLEEMFCCSFQFLSYLNSHQLKFFPSMKIITISCSYEELVTNFSLIEMLQIPSNFPNLVELRLLNTSKGISIFDGHIMKGSCHKPAISVTSIGFDKIPSRRLLFNLSREFPNIQTVSLRDSNAFYRISKIWKNLKHIKLYQDTCRKKACLLTANILGINSREMDLLQNNNIANLHLLNIVPSKPTVTDLLKELQDITLINLRSRIHSDSHRFLKVLTERRSGVKIKLDHVDSHSYFWNWNECL